MSRARVTIFASRLRIPLPYLHPLSRLQWRLLSHPHLHPPPYPCPQPLPQRLLLGGVNHPMKTLERYNISKPKTSLLTRLACKLGLAESVETA